MLAVFLFFTSLQTHLHMYKHSLSLSFTHTVRHTLSQFLYHSYTLSSDSVIVGNGLNSPHNGERDSPADRQSTMPPSVPIRKDKKDVPVSSRNLSRSSVSYS